MTLVADVAEFLETFAPRALAADWDNVGLLLGDEARPVARLMTCLTLTAAVVEEAVAERVDLVVAHHPLPFKPVRSLSTATFDGRRLWQLASAGVSVYSPHTAFDSAARGINARFVERLGLVDVEPLLPAAPSSAAVADPTLGVGRIGRLPQPLALDDLAKQVKAAVAATSAAVVGDAQRKVTKIAVGCGSAGDLLKPAAARGCDCFITGEANFHTAIEAEAMGTGLILVGHYASERFGVELLAEELRAAFPKLEVWPARHEIDPLRPV